MVYLRRWWCQMVLGLSCRKIQRVPKKSQNGENDPELKITFKLEKATSLKKMEVDVDFKHETEQKCCKRQFLINEPTHHKSFKTFKGIKFIIIQQSFSTHHSRVPAANYDTLMEIFHIRSLADYVRTAPPWSRWQQHNCWWLHHSGFEI